MKFHTIRPSDDVTDMAYLEKKRDQFQKKLNEVVFINWKNKSLYTVTEAGQEKSIYFLDDEGEGIAK